jgi:hypothetical protein
MGFPHLLSAFWRNKSVQGQAEPDPDTGGVLMDENDARPSRSSTLTSRCVWMDEYRWCKAKQSLTLTPGGWMNMMQGSAEPNLDIEVCVDE